MQKVITVSLNGNAYQLDEDAYAQLSRYLDQAAAALAGNPDQAEIVADLEQAIGEKCARYLNAHKTVVIGAELRQIIAEMGPVDGAPGPAEADPQAAAPGVGASGFGTSGGAGAGGATGHAGATGAPPFVSRRLYQISDGAVLSGVCNGLAAYFAVDVTLVRAIFIALFLLTGGVALLGYVVLMFVVPYASTSEEHAAARGLPFNARALVERAKQKYSQFAQGAEWRGTRAEWRREWRRMRAEWRFERRRMRDEWRTHWRFGRSAPPPGTTFGSGGAAGTSGVRAAPVSYIAHVIIGTLLAVLGIVSAILTIGWLLVLMSLITTGAILGWTLPHDIPLSAALLVLLLVYGCVAWPIRALRHAAYVSVGAYHGAWVEAWNGIIACAVVVTVLWFGFHHEPEVRELFNGFIHWWNSVVGGDLADWT
jgi:phage shock protein PspC (stress-responsive transcriptional regulator)